MPVLDLVALASLAALAATWIAYPAAVAALAALRPRRSAAAWPEPPRVSCVVATRGAAAEVRARVLDLLATAHPADRLEVVVALDREPLSGEAGALAAADPRVRVVVGGTPGRGKAGALNAGVAAARGEVLIFADTHQRFAPETIPNLVEALAAPRVGAVSGRLLLPAGGASLVRRYWALERRLRRDEARLHSCVGVTGAVWAMRRELWKPLPAGLILDDVHTPMRLVLEGWRVDFRDDAPATETRRSSGRGEYRRKSRTLTGNLQLCAWLPAVLSPLRNPLWLPFLLHKLARLATPYAAAGLALWAAVRGFSALGDLRLPALAAATTGLLWLLRTRTPLGTRLRAAAGEALLVQAAVVSAGVNGLRGRWEVWDG